MILFDREGNHYREVNSERWIVEDEFFQDFYRVERPRQIGEVEMTLGGVHPDGLHGSRIPYPLDRFRMRGTIMDNYCEKVSSESPFYGR